MPVAIGDTAPDFELLGQRAGEGAPTFKLSDALQRGGVVLQFFPLPFTGVCRAQMEAVRDDAQDYRTAGVTVWGVTGHYPQLIEAWDRDYHFDTEILADYDHAVSEAYVGLYEPPTLPQGLRMTTKRGVVGISADGIVRFVWITEEPGVGPDDQIVADAIRAASGEA